MQISFVQEKWILGDLRGHDRHLGSYIWLVIRTAVVSYFKMRLIDFVLLKLNALCSFGNKFPTGINILNNVEPVFSATEADKAHCGCRGTISIFTKMSRT